MSGLTPAELYDVLDRVIEDAPLTLWPGRGRPVIWFNVAEVRIGGKAWSAIEQAPAEHGYTLAQARQMRNALLPVLAEYMKATEALVTGPLETHS